MIYERLPTLGSIPTLEMNITISFIQVEKVEQGWSHYLEVEWYYEEKKVAHAI